VAACCNDGKRANALIELRLTVGDPAPDLSLLKALDPLSAVVRSRRSGTHLSVELTLPKQGAQAGAA
jgi:hypothetical protein